MQGLWYERDCIKGCHPKSATPIRGPPLALNPDPPIGIHRTAQSLRAQILVRWHGRTYALSARSEGHLRLGWRWIQIRCRCGPKLDADLLTASCLSRQHGEKTIVALHRTKPPQHPNVGIRDARGKSRPASSPAGHIRPALSGRSSAMQYTTPLQLFLPRIARSAIPYSKKPKR
jgi:hypothetical protein